METQYDVKYLPERSVSETAPLLPPLRIEAISDTIASDVNFMCPACVVAAIQPFTPSAEIQAQNPNLHVFHFDVRRSDKSQSLLFYGSSFHIGSDRELTILIPATYGTVLHRVATDTKTKENAFTEDEIWTLNESAFYLEPMPNAGISASEAVNEILNVWDTDRLTVLLEGGLYLLPLKVRVETQFNPQLLPENLVNLVSNFSLPVYSSSDTGDVIITLGESSTTTLKNSLRESGTNVPDFAKGTVSDTLSYQFQRDVGFMVALGTLMAQAGIELSIEHMFDYKEIRDGLASDFMVRFGSYFENTLSTEDFDIKAVKAKLDLGIEPTDEEKAAVASFQSDFLRRRPVIQVSLQPDAISQASVVGRDASATVDDDNASLETVEDTDESPAIPKGLLPEKIEHCLAFEIVYEQALISGAVIAMQLAVFSAERLLLWTTEMEGNSAEDRYQRLGILLRNYAALDLSAQYALERDSTLQRALVEYELLGRIRDAIMEQQSLTTLNQEWQELQNAQYAELQSELEGADIVSDLPPTDCSLVEPALLGR